MHELEKLETATGLDLLLTIIGLGSPIAREPEGIDARHGLSKTESHEVIIISIS